MIGQLGLWHDISVQEPFTKANIDTSANLLIKRYLAKKAERKCHTNIKL